MTTERTNDWIATGVMCLVGLLAVVMVVNTMKESRFADHVERGGHAAMDTRMDAMEKWKEQVDQRLSTLETSK